MLVISSIVLHLACYHLGGWPNGIPGIPGIIGIPPLASRGSRCGLWSKLFKGGYIGGYVVEYYTVGRGYVGGYYEFDCSSRGLRAPEAWPRRLRKFSTTVASGLTWRSPHGFLHKSRVSSLKTQALPWGCATVQELDLKYSFADSRDPSRPWTLNPCLEVHRCSP